MKNFFFLITLSLSFTFVYAQKKSPDYSYIITSKKVLVKNEKSDDSSAWIEGKDSDYRAVHTRRRKFAVAESVAII